MWDYVGLEPETSFVISSPCDYACRDRKPISVGTLASQLSDPISPGFIFSDACLEMDVYLIPKGQLYQDLLKFSQSSSVDNYPHFRMNLRGLASQGLVTWE